MTLSLVSFAQDLIRCSSVTPESAGVIDLLSHTLKMFGFCVTPLKFCEDGTPDVENLFATRGTGSPHIMFSGHSDVVPAGDAALWLHPPFDGVIENNILYGRGAVDMKSSLAAFVFAADRFFQIRGEDAAQISLLITNDEEGPGINGSVKLLKWAHEQGHRFDFALVGEPTCSHKLGDTLKIGRRGSLSGQVVVTGQQGHVAYPHMAVNPCHGLPAVISALCAPLDQGYDVFEPSSLQIVSVDTDNSALNVIPAAVTLTFNVRFNPHFDAASLEDELRQRLSNLGVHADLSFQLRCFPSNSPPFLTVPDARVKAIQNAVEAVCGVAPELSVSGGTSDARFVKDYCSVIEFGPLNGTIHQVDECISCDDLERLQLAYEGILIAIADCG